MRLKAGIVCMAVKDNLPFAGVIKAGGQIEHRCLARAVGADEAHKAMVFHGDGKIR